MNYSYQNCWLNIKLENWKDKTLQDFYDIYIPSKKIQHLLIQNKHILMDGENVKRETLLNGTTLSIMLYQNDKSIPCDDIDIVYEDELLIILNKPAGIIVHDDGCGSANLTDLANKHFADCIAIHRLDKETSGLIVFSKSAVFQPLLDKMMTNREIHRFYLAFCQGLCQNSQQLEINDKLAKDRHNSNKVVVSKNGVEAFTKAKVVKLDKKRNITIFECQLLTGRTHQIRVHLASKKYYILNDELYGFASKHCKTMGLVAYKIQFVHPLTRKQICIETKLPNDLAALLKKEN